MQQHHSPCRLLALPVILHPVADRVINSLPVLDNIVINAEQRAGLAISQFVSDHLLKHSEWWQLLIEQPPEADEWQHYQMWYQQALQSVVDEAGLMKTARLFRQKILVRIAWAQTLQLCSTEQTLRQLSELAEVLIVETRNWLYQAACRDWGTPQDQQGNPQPLLILGMGKLGGAELNFSSDIDLIFIYPENGVTHGGRKELENSQFFTRLGQRLIKVLDQVTIDGFVYRVDMRLRPFGDSGPLVMSFSAFEDYYQEQGRDWERYAMVKARIMGDTHQGYCLELQQMLRPFIYRRYIDFSVIQSLRNMKSMISREVRRRGLTDNIKLGAGGIREIEFITQVFQLIRGGREPILQNRQLLPTLTAIAELGLLTVEQTEQLRDSYLFLRRLENLLQAIADRQTQTLPDDPEDCARLAWGMGCDNWCELIKILTQKMSQVRIIFDELIGDDSAEADESSDNAAYSALWQSELELNELCQLMPQLSEQQCELINRIISDFRQDIEKRPIGHRGRDVLDQLMPNVLTAICVRDDAAILLPRLCHLLLSIVTRTTYLELLLEYPSALAQLLQLCAASPMVASQLASYPILLDELLDQTSLYQPTPLNAYRDELRQYLLRVPEDDEEQHLEALRQFKQTQLLRIAAADIRGNLPVMKVSDHLTYLAEAMIDAVVQQAWSQMVKRYGQPSHLNRRNGRGFAVVAYGKLGGIELGYSSDLDLVFIIDCPANIVTDGERSIDGRQFYLRLTQRVIHLFNTRMASGVLYEVDTRLRPSGESGLLVTTIDAFSDYQRNQAWTWEHQALVRARMVYGDPQLQQQFDDLRHEILCRPRDSSQLRQEVREMREKMHSNLAPQRSDEFDLKADIGGITDIEFIAQYLVLQYAHQQPKLTQWSDNVRIFELMGLHGVMPAEEAQSLTQAYVAMRDAMHHLALQDKAGRVASTQYQQEQQQVKTSWQHWLSN